MENTLVTDNENESTSASFTATYREFENHIYQCPSVPWGHNTDQPFVWKDTITHGWAKLLRHNLTALHEDVDIELHAYYAPRRKSRNPHEAGLAKDVAQLLYPSPSDSTLAALIKYQKDTAELRRAIRAQKAIAEEQRSKLQGKPTLKERIKTHECQSWDWNGRRERNLDLLKGVRALPMPVQVSSENSLSPFFDHLRVGGGYDVDVYGNGNRTEEPYYRTEMGEWEKGMLYQDGRMDLCKKVVGPDHIGQLMTSLESNTFVRHFLLGNNIIGSSGATKIAAYLLRHPNQIETWYLAGNCIDAGSIKLLAERFITSTSITNVWLKRNPLGPSSIEFLATIITKTRHLRTLDLDQTELGDRGVTMLFHRLIVAYDPNIPLRHLYLNATGIGVTACALIAEYLGMGDCPLVSLYMSNNPIGDDGASALAEGLIKNRNLVRLSIRSCDIRSTGAIAIMNALKNHLNIMTLNLSHSYATQDLHSQYNYVGDEVKDATFKLLESSQSLRFLDFGITGMTVHCITEIATAVQNSRLLVFKAVSVDGRIPLSIRHKIQAALTRNVQATYGKETTYAAFEEGEQRWLVSPPDVRFIDSGYRNRDAGLARRGLMILDKHWEEPDELTRIINNVEDDYPSYDMGDVYERL
ncbi:MAG: hypothetical protein Q9204_002546 [Flavoplaca sp. TL-2023a]